MNSLRLINVLLSHIVHENSFNSCQLNNKEMLYNLIALDISKKLKIFNDSESDLPLPFHFELLYCPQEIAFGLCTFLQSTLTQKALLFLFLLLLFFTAFSLIMDPHKKVWMSFLHKYFFLRKAFLEYIASSTFIQIST